MPNNLGIIIQARLTSSRLPGKVLKPFYQNQSILAIIVHQAQKHFGKDNVWVATSESPENDPVEKFCNENGAKCFRGDENDVLSRFQSIIQKEAYDYVFRICADNPFLDVQSFHTLLDSCHDEDYVSFANSEGTPTIKTHFGIWAELVKSSTLLNLSELNIDFFFKEHVTNYIYTHQDDYKVNLQPIPQLFQGRNDIRLTIDTPEDFATAQTLFAKVYDGVNVDYNKLVALIDEDQSVQEKMKTEIEKNGK